MQRIVKTRHLEAVIALAEELHYGRAAERVGLTQSGLSRCIQSHSARRRRLVQGLSGAKKLIGFP